MRVNQDTLIIGHKVCLVPYRKEHVEKYHEWMQSEELQQLTASEPLSLVEEYSMQQTWLNDSNKCTFIILERGRLDLESGIAGEVDSMVGDVNLFFNDPTSPREAEVEVMIAEPQARRKGLGKEALLAMCYFGVMKLDVQKITAKIGLENAASLHMFALLGFAEVSRSEVFKEVTLHLPITCKSKEKIATSMQHLLFEKTIPAD